LLETGSEKGDNIDSSNDKGALIHAK